MQRPIEAQVIDSRHLKLKKPIKIAPGSTVMVTIEPPGGISEEKEWYILSSQGIDDAYSDSEPEYSLDKIKVANPDYQA